MQIDAASTVVRAGQQHFAWVDTDMLAMDEQAESVYALNQSAGRVWELIERPVAVSVVCDQLQSEFAVDKETCLRETILLLQGLHDAGLVKVDDAPLDTSAT